MTRKYPLDPLRRVREEAVDQKVRALSESLRHVEATRGQAERAERRQRELESALEAAAVAERRRLHGGELTAGETATYLLLFSVLFLLRVAGQVLVVLRAPSWLPPMHQWHLMPYRLLLPIQLGFILVMALIEVGLATAIGPFVNREPGLGRFLIGFSFVYAGAMLLRYAVRMYRQPRERWFGGAIPIVFHFVLAAFLFTWGKYHVSG